MRCIGTSSERRHSRQLRSESWRRDVALELRFAEGACANQDIDIGVPVEESKRLPAFQDAVALGFDDFTFLLKGNLLNMDKVDGKRPVLLSITHKLSTE
jgi:hypothetical protein